MLDNLPFRREVVRALELSVESYSGIVGPGKWVIDSGRGFIALSWICELGQVPPDFNGEIPWKLLGGDEILLNAGVCGDLFAAGKTPTGGYFCSAIIPIRETETLIN
jgi:hypothetical protein